MTNRALHISNATVRLKIHDGPCPWLISIPQFYHWKPQEKPRNIKMTHLWKTIYPSDLQTIAKVSRSPCCALWLKIQRSSSTPVFGGAYIWFYTDHINYPTERSSAFTEELRRRTSHVHSCSETTKATHFALHRQFMITYSKAYLFRSTEMKNQPWVPSRRDITDLQKERKNKKRSAMN